MKTKNQNTFAVIAFGIPQSSMLGLLLFKIYVCDLLFKIRGIDI